MKYLERLLQALALAAVLGQAGCASTPPVVYATEAEARSARGEPTARLDNGDGTTTLEYAAQPTGTTCLRVQVDAEGKVVRQWDALARDNLAQVKPGMSKEDVSRLLGPRRSERVYPGTDDEVWDWNIRHRGRGSETLFNVHFSKGLVKYTDRIRIYPENEWADRPYPYLFLGVPWIGFGFGHLHPYWGGRHWHGGGRGRGWGGRGRRP